MDQPDNSFKLRMKTTSGAGTPDPAPKEIVVYHWGRIFGALAALVLLVAGLVWLVWPTAETDQTNVRTASEKPEIAAEKTDNTSSSMPTTETTSRQDETSTDTRSANDGDKPLISSADQGSDSTTGPAAESSQATLSAVPPSASTADAAIANSNSAGSSGETSGISSNPAMSESPEKASQPADRPADNAKPASEATQISQSTPDTATDDEPETTRNNGPDKAEVTVQSDHLNRAALSRTLQDKEPGTELPANVTMNKEGIIRVYFFNELENLEGKTVFHDWYRDDKRVARVTIRPYSDEQRASSAKYINRNMLGQWRVKAVTKDGELLGGGHFTVVGRGETE